MHRSSIVGLAIVILGGQLTPNTRADDPAATIDISPLASIDENLFAIRTLSFVFDSWAHSNSSIASSDQISNLRSQLRQLRREFRTRNVDEDVRLSIDSIDRLVDMYELNLINVGIISSNDAEAQKKMNEEGNAQTTWTMIKMNVAKDIHGALLVLAEDVVEQGIQYLIKSSSLDSVKTKALEDEKTRLIASKTATLRKLKETFHELAKLHKWNPSEAGFDATDEEQAILNKPITSQDERKAKIKLLEDWMQRRPRDPFLILEYVQTKRYMVDLTPADMETLSEHAIRSARLVPAGEGYDAYRALFLYTAADLANRTSIHTLYGKSRFTADLPINHRGIALWDATLRTAQGDPKGEIRAKKAWSLAMAGRPDLAHQLASSVSDERLRAKDKGYAYNVACLYSSVGNTSLAIHWFENAVAFGFDSPDELAYAIEDPDLEKMRGAYTSRFLKLTQAKSK